MYVKENRRIYKEEDSSSSSSSSDSESTKTYKNQLAGHHHRHHHHREHHHHAGPRSIVSAVKDTTTGNHLHQHRHQHQHNHVEAHNSQTEVQKQPVTQVTVIPISSTTEHIITKSSKPSHKKTHLHVSKPKVVDVYQYSESDKSNKSEIYPNAIVSETKIVKERRYVPESTKSSTTSISDKFSDKSSEMGKYESFDYERSNGGFSFEENASVSDVYGGKSKEFTFKSGGHISSAHVAKANTFTIPCHHIRIGDLVILQHRPCQIIRITTSAQTGQHRYLGVDLFTKQLHEEPCVVSHPSPSVVLHSLLGPVFKQYRLIDIREDGKLVAMTETGEIKQGLRVVDQGRLWSRLKEAFGRGSASVRVLVIADSGNELAVDYKIVHLAHKL